MNYIKLLLITKLGFIDIKLEIFRKASYIYNNLSKLRKNIKPG